MKLSLPPGPLWMKNPYVHLGIGMIALSSLFAFSSHTAFRPVPDASLKTPTPVPSPTPWRLEPVPQTVNAVYLTGYSTGNSKKIKEIIDLADTTELNGVVIDIKDYAGKIFFQTNSTLIHSIGSEEIRIPDFKNLIATLHEHHIYVSARIAVFQDAHLSKVRPDLAIKNSQTGAIWKDRKGLSWVDPGSRDVWDYNLEVAREAIALGVDEINFDYVRFPSDGDMTVLSYPLYNPNALSKAEQMQKFFAYVHEVLGPMPVKTSVDLFGLATINEDDLGIGQIIEYAYPYFDYIAPMVYPSHYAKGFLGYQNPASYPYEVIFYSLEKAQVRRSKLDAVLSYVPSPTPENSTSTPLKAPDVSYIKTQLLPRNSKIAKLRPWLQVFDIGATYTPEMVRKQIQATLDTNNDSGWYLWNPSNIYNPGIFARE
ncbi:MAG: hypothetical protein UX66_C0006G0007 [Parcubacteria group bacterium GW2011_GWF2_46_8]|nr:MAG: hypothetical protein UX66_C0006G0007 [Parcubacteria group bacterium GW2011_GWF2_46_8]